MAVMWVLLLLAAVWVVLPVMVTIIVVRGLGEQSGSGRARDVLQFHIEVRSTVDERYLGLLTATVERCCADFGGTGSSVGGGCEITGASELPAHNDYRIDVDPTKVMDLVDALKVRTGRPVSVLDS